MLGRVKEVDHYQKLQTQIRKNFEVLLEQQMGIEQEDVSSDFFNEQILRSQVDGQNLKLFISTNEEIQIPQSIFDMETIQQFLSFETYKNIFSSEDLKHLSNYLPQSLNDEQKEITIKALLSGESFHFGSPFEQFLSKCQSGYFTKSRVLCEKYDKEISQINNQNYYAQLQNFVGQPGHMENAKKNIRKYMLKQFSPGSSISGQSVEKKIRLNEDNQSHDSISTTSSQSFSPPQYIQQQPATQMNLPLQFPSSSQSLFATAPITTLPQYTSTSLLTNLMTLAYLQARKQFKKPGCGPSGVPGTHPQSKLKLESTVPTGQSDRQWLESYWKQEIERYRNPLHPYTFNCIDGSRATVAPAAKKLLSGLSSKPRQHELLKNERPPYVTILSLVRDAAARLPKGYGTRADIMNLVKDSQFINENLPDEKMSSIISGALDRLHQSGDPCVKYDQEKKIWIYLHHDRDQTFPDWQVAVPQTSQSQTMKSKKPKQDIK